MLLRLLILLSGAGGTLLAQTTCPGVNFLSAHRSNLKPTTTTHTDVVRQADGSYTGFEVADAPPYRLIQSTPHFEKQFAACLPHASPATPVSLSGANPAGVGSQPVASMPAGGGSFLAHISADQLILYFDVFDAQHNLTSESPFQSVVSPPGYVGSANERFQSLLLADLNGDGKADLLAVLTTPLAADIDYGGVWTFLGNGDGTFQTGQRQVLTTRSLLGAALGAAVADLNGDGKADIVLTQPNSGTTNVFLGNGDGTFQSKALPITVPAACGPPTSVALGDLNRDGKVDLAYGCSAPTPQIAIALGNGDGTFGNASLYASLPLATSTGANASIAIGDVNGDGIPDVVSASGTILFGDGSGGVASRADYEPNLASAPLAERLGSGAGPILLADSVVLGDFDGDGHTDIIFGTGNAGSLSANSNYPTLSVLFGDGAGGFAGAPVSGVPLPSSALTYSGPLPPPLATVATADFNRDGKQDAAVVTFVETADAVTRQANGITLQITTLRGQGNGQFGGSSTQSFSYSSAIYLRSAAAGDFNHDGKPDLAVLLSDLSGGVVRNGEIQIYPGRGDGSFGAAMVTPLSIDNPETLVSADLNGDGTPDLVVTANTGLYVFLSKGDGSITGPVQTFPGGDESVAIADFNGDGKLDLAVTNNASSAVIVYLGKGDGTFLAPVNSALPAAAPGFQGNLVAGDFNGDGRLDVAAALGVSATGVQQVSILPGNGDGTFGAALPPQPAMENMTVADINGDRIADLIGLVSPLTAPQGGAQGALSVRLGNGDGTFQADNVVLGASAYYAVADVNHDGSPDVLDLYGSGLLSLINLSQPAASLTVLNGASFAAGPLAPGSFASAFGTEFIPAGTSSGVFVTVQDSGGVGRMAVVDYVSPTQINFVIPPSTAIGPATVTVTNSMSGKAYTAAVAIAAVSPGLFTAGNGVAAAYAVEVSPYAAQTIVPIFTAQSGSIVPIPLDVTQPGSMYLSLFGTGFDGANATFGSVSVQGVAVPVTFAGAQGTPGLDQLNIQLPASLAGTGVATITWATAGTVSNQVIVNIK